MSNHSLPSYKNYANLKDYVQPNYHNNTLFDQSVTGFGLSNFRSTEQNPLASSEIRDIQTERDNKLLFTQHYQDYKLIEQDKVDENYVYWDIIKTFQERNPLLDVFFSKKNLDHIQILIIKMVAHQSQNQYKISRQSDSELLTIMRSIYIKTPTNPHSQGEELKNEICKLNKNVLDWVIPRLITNIQQHLSYLRDHSAPIAPQERPQYMSSSGTKITQGFDNRFI